MKAVIVCVLFVAAAIKAQSPEEALAKIIEFRKECMDETHVDSAMLKKTLTGEFSDDPKLKDHLFCFYKKIGFMNDGGKVESETIKNKSMAMIKNQELVDKYMADCAKDGSDGPQTAFDLAKCSYGHLAANKKEVLEALLATHP